MLKTDKPTQEQIDSTHKAYVQALKELYEEYNPIYGDPSINLNFIWILQNPKSTLKWNIFTHWLVYCLVSDSICIVITISVLNYSILQPLWIWIEYLYQNVKKIKLCW